MIPQIDTDRLNLGAFTMAHFEAFAAFSATPRSEFLGGPTTDRRDAWDSCMIHNGQWMARGYGAFWATETATGLPVGRFSLWHPITFDEPELSWVVFDGFEGRGFAAEGAAAVRAWAGRARIAPLQSLIAAANRRSIALAERLGARFEAETEYPNGVTVQRYRHPRPEHLS
jgi:RimJ/RimL family protein N-acetyltransferase